MRKKKIVKEMAKALKELINATAGTFESSYPDYTKKDAARSKACDKAKTVYLKWREYKGEIPKEKKVKLKVTFKELEKIAAGT